MAHIMNEKIYSEFDTYSYSKEIIISIKPAEVNGIPLIFRPLPSANK